MGSSLQIQPEKLKALEHLFQVTSFNLPSIPCSLPLRCHPNNVSLTKVTDEWAFKYLRLNSDTEKNRLVQWRMPMYFTFVIPESPREEALAACKFSWVSAFMDDPLDSGENIESSAAKKFHQTFLRLSKANHDIVELKNSGYDDLVFKSYVDMMGDYRRLMQPSTLEYFINCVQRWSESFMNEPPYDMFTYMPLRRDSSLTAPTLALLEMCSGVTLGQKDRESPEFESMALAAMDHTWLVNDVISFRKEFVQSKRLTNLVVILLLTDPAVNTLQQAVDKVCNMIQEKEEQFRYYHSICLRNATENRRHDLVKYLKLVPYMVSGSWHWHYVTARYHGVDNPIVTGKPFHGTLLLQPDQTIILPSGPAGEEFGKLEPAAFDYFKMALLPV